MDYRFFFKCFSHFFFPLFFGMSDSLDRNSVFSPWHEQFVLSGPQKVYSPFEKCCPSYFFLRTRKKKTGFKLGAGVEAALELPQRGEKREGNCVSSSFGVRSCDAVREIWCFDNLAERQPSIVSPGEQGGGGRGGGRGGGTLWFCDRCHSTSGSWQAPPGWESLASTSAADEPALNGAEQSAVSLPAVAVSPFILTRSLSLSLCW